MLPSMLIVIEYSVLERVPRSASGISLLEKLMIIFLSQYNTISVLKISLIERSLSQPTSSCPNLTTETLTLKTPEQLE